jgi:S1-C subfamily serine protease
VTKGVVSRVDVSEYSHSSTYLLSVQIDAAINAGNSGGPAIMHGQCVGVAFQTLEDAENIGYVVPTPIIHHFLEDIEKHKTYRGFCSVPVLWQPTENPNLRRFLRIPDGVSGVLINQVHPLSYAAKVLRPFDVLAAIDGEKIANDGTVPFVGDQRIAFSHIVARFFAGDMCTLRIVRDGREVDVSTRMENAPYLVPVHLYDKDPSYFIFAGLVFTVLSRPFLYHGLFARERERRARGAGWERREARGGERGGGRTRGR